MKKWTEPFKVPRESPVGYRCKTKTKFIQKEVTHRSINIGKRVDVLNKKTQKTMSVYYTKLPKLTLAKTQKIMCIYIAQTSTLAQHQQMHA